MSELTEKVNNRVYFLDKLAIRDGQACTLRCEPYEMDNYSIGLAIEALNYYEEKEKRNAP